MGKTTWRPQLLEVAMAVQEGIRVEKDDFWYETHEKDFFRRNKRIFLDGKIFQLWLGTKFEAGYDFLATAISRRILL